jgi:3-deoxy-manno-octulosonate cytidylyltransferase (CMP-KDO synthetase)
MLLPIAGKPLIAHTLERANAARTVDRVIVATDDERIRDAVCQAGGEAAMTLVKHHSGSDRIAEVAERLPEGTIIVNLQGDEPLIAPETIDRAVRALQNDAGADMSTAYEPITSKWAELLNGNVVKVVVGDNGHALYFSRSPFPFPREASLRHGGDPGRALDEEPQLLSNYKKHTGLYVFRREYLLRFTKLPRTWLEKYEMLEQLRALEDGARIRVVEAAGRSIGVDTQEDYERVCDLIEVGVDIRPARRSDLQRVAEVHVDSWQRSFAGIAPDDFLAGMTIETRLKAYSERACTGNYSMLVADHPTEGIVGFADFGTPTLPGGYDAQIYSIYLLPEFQRKGLGTRLFERCVERIRAGQNTTLCLDSLEVSPYRAFYDKMGGRVVAGDAHKLGDKEYETVIYVWDEISTI